MCNVHLIIFHEVPEKLSNENVPIIKATNNLKNLFNPIHHFITNGNI